MTSAIRQRHPEAGTRLIAEFKLFDLKHRSGKTRQTIRKLRRLDNCIGISNIGEKHLGHRILDEALIEYLHVAPEFTDSLHEDAGLTREFIALNSQAHHQESSVIMPEVEREDQVIEFWQASVDLIQGDDIEQQ